MFKGILDDLDRKLLNFVQVDNRQSATVLGKHIGLSASAVQRRLQRMRASGVIEADLSVVDPEAMGRHLMAIVVVTLEREGRKWLETFKRTMTSVPEVLQCYYVTGDSDFVLMIVTKNMPDFDQLTKRIFSSNRNVKRFTTHIVMARVKRNGKVVC